MARVLKESNRAEIDNLAGAVNDRLTAVSAEPSDVDTLPDYLYQPLETK